LWLLVSGSDHVWGWPNRRGLALDRGILLNAFLETSVPGIYAAGDIAGWPDPHSDETIRVEHWVVAQRQGQTALNMLGGARDSIYCRSSGASTTMCRSNGGHAEQWDEIVINGNITAKDCLLKYKRNGRLSRSRFDIPRSRKPAV
jgi:apoptosis-inducing factor 3